MTQTVVSLFSGCGGLDKSAQDAGLTILESHEYDPIACEGYERVTGMRIEQSDLSRKDPNTFPDADGFIGGPPCQAFSQGNKYASPENIKNMWPHTINIIRAKRPSWFVFENVRGLVSQHRPYFDWVLSEFQSIGYTVDWRVLNAADYGVPQTRERVFVVGRLDGETWNWPNPTHAKHQTLFNPSWVSWKSALSTWKQTAQKGQMPAWVLKRDGYDPMPTDGYFNTQEMNHKRLHRDGDEPAFTVLTGHAQRVRVVIGGQVYQADNRAMGLIQTLPDVELASHVIGNAVPPLLGRAVFEAMRT